MNYLQRKYAERGRSLKPALIPANLHYSAWAQKRKPKWCWWWNAENRLIMAKQQSHALFSPPAEKRKCAVVSGKREKNRKNKVQQMSCSLPTTAASLSAFRSNLRSGLLWRRAAESFNILCTNNLLKCTYNVLSPWTATAKVERKEFAQVVTMWWRREETRRKIQNRSTQTGTSEG